MGKEALGSPLSFLLSFSLFPIFLSGVGVRVSVLGLGFFHLPSFFDIWKKVNEGPTLVANPLQLISDICPEGFCFEAWLLRSRYSC